MKQVLILTMVVMAGCASNPQATRDTRVAAAKTEKQVMTETQVVPTEAEAAAAGKKVICREAAPTGSHRKRVTCRTSDEIKREREQARELMRDAARRGIFQPR